MAPSYPVPDSFPAGALATPSAPAAAPECPHPPDSPHPPRPTLPIRPRRPSRYPAAGTIRNFVCGLRLVDVESVAVGHFQDVQDGLPARDASGGLARFGLLPDGQR